jgi:hypothetical protein
MIRDEQLLAFNQKYSQINENISALRDKEINEARSLASNMIQNTKMELSRLGVDEEKLQDLARYDEELSSKMPAGVSPDAQEELFYRYAEQTYPELEGNIGQIREKVSEFNYALAERELNNRNSPTFEKHFMKDGKINVAQSASYVKVKGGYHQSKLAKLTHHFPSSYKSFEKDAAVLATALATDLHRLDPEKKAQNLEYLIEHSNHPAFRDPNKAYFSGEDTRQDLRDEVQLHAQHIGVSHIDAKKISDRKFDKVIAAAASEVKRGGLPRGALSEMSAVAQIAMQKARDVVPKEQLSQFMQRLSEKTGVKLTENTLTERPNLHVVTEKNLSRH